MENSFEETIKEWGNDTEEKRRKVLDTIKNLDAAELQVIYQSLFFDEIIETFNRIPAPSKQLTEKEIDDVIFKSRRESGFYTKNSD